MKPYLGKQHFGNRYSGIFIAICLLTWMGFNTSSTAAAQDQATAGTPPPKVLVIMREFLKPGMAGSPHERTESAFVQAMSAAHSPEHYIAMNSLSGPSRALFFLGYDSLGAWGKDNEAMMKNTTLAQSFDSAQQADGKLLTRYDSGVFLYQPDKSIGSPINIGSMRYMEITRLKVRLGHEADWEEMVKMHNTIYGKLPHARWAMFRKEFGTDSGTTYLAIRPLHSLAELDEFQTAARQAESQLSADDKKKIDGLDASTFRSVETNLFAFSPKMSYASDHWKAADPGFWGQQ